MMPPPNSPPPYGQPPPPTAPRWVPLLGVLSVPGTLIYAITCAVLASDKPDGLLLYVGATSPFVLVLTAVFYLALRPHKGSMARPARVVLAFFYAVGFVGFAGLVLGVIAVGLVLGACFCGRR